MLRVLHVIPSVSATRGGPTHAVLGIVRKQNSLGIRSEIVTTDDDGPSTLDVPLNCLSEYEGCPIYFFHRWDSRFSAVREYAVSVPLTFWLMKNAGDYDILHIHALFSFPSTIGMLTARFKQRPYVVRPLGLLCAWSLRQKATKKRLYLRLVEHRNLNNATIIEYSTPGEQNEVANLKLRPASIVLPLGFELQDTLPAARQQLRAKFGIPEDTAIIVYLSRLHPKKGLDVLLRSLTRLTGIPFRLIIAGGGQLEYERAIDALISELGLGDVAFRVGFVEGEDKALILQGADIFALTSHSESFGIAVAEAMAAGLPTIVTPGVPLAPVIEENHFGWVPRLDEHEIARAVANALADLEFTKKKGARAAAYAREHYTWEAFVGHLASLYRAIASKRNIDDEAADLLGVQISRRR